MTFPFMDSMIKWIPVVRGLFSVGVSASAANNKPRGAKYTPDQGRCSLRQTGTQVNEAGFILETHILNVL